jgi:hypothetical protein
MTDQPDLRERFLRAVPDRPADGCWLWTRCKGRQGYGYISVEGRGRKATHVSIYLKTGEWPPKGMFVCHSCDNPPCVNPDHLWIGTCGDNARDMVAKGRNVHPNGLPPDKQPRGTRHGSAKLTEDDVRAIRASSEPYLKMAAHYGVDECTIYNVRSRRKWKHIP